MPRNADILELETRRKIFNFILNNPGLHLREVSRRINIPRATLRYHLGYLKKQDLIIEETVKKSYMRYYCRNKVSTDDKKILTFLRQKTTRDILLYYLCFIVASRLELSNNLEKKSTTIAFHLKKLLEADIIEPAPVGKNVIHRIKSPRVIVRSPVGREMIYRLKNPKMVYDAFISYQYNIIDNASTKIIAEALNRFYIEGLYKNKKIKKFESAIDSIEELLYDIIPPPFCA